MTALAANTALQLRNLEGRKRGSALIATSAVIYHNALVDQDTSGFVRPSAVGTTTSFFGIAVIDTPTGTGGLTGDGTSVYVDVEWGMEALLPSATAVTIGLVGQPLYSLDDASVTSSATTTKGPQVGILVEVPAALTSWVAIRSAAMAKGTTS